MNDINHLNVHLATPEDGIAIYEQLRDSGQEIGLTYSFVEQKYQDWVIEQCASGLAWVVKVDDHVIGAMILDKFELSYIVVAVEARGKGVCQKLIDHAKILRCKLTAEVKENNRLMIKRLTDNGFCPFERIKTPGMNSYVWLK